MIFKKTRKVKVIKKAPALVLTPLKAFGVAGIMIILPQLLMAIIMVLFGKDTQWLASLTEWPMAILQLIIAVVGFGILWKMAGGKKGIDSLGWGLKTKLTQDNLILLAKTFGLYLLASIGAILLVSGFLSEEILKMPQDTGFEVVSRDFLQLLAIFISLVIIAPIFEEVVFRGILFKGLRNKFNFWQSAVIASLFFALLHGQINVGIDVFVMGLAAAWLFEQTKTIYTPIIFHAIKNLIAFTLVFVFV